MPDADMVADIQQIRFRLEAIESSQYAIIRANEPELRKQVDALFEQYADLARVYLAIDGKRTQKEILDHLNASGASISQPTLSRRMELLRDSGLLDLVPSKKAGDVYEHNRVLERILHVSKRVKPTP